MPQTDPVRHRPPQQGRLNHRPLSCKTLAELMAGVSKYRVTAIAILSACLLLQTGAAAQEQGERAAAEVLFEQGREAMAAGDYDEACAKFEASMALDSAPGTLMNLGNCEEQRGNIASAWERYVAAQRELPSSDRRRDFAAEKVQELEPRVPKLTITIASSAPEGTQVRRDDIDLTGSVGVALPLDPGTYEITASAEGYNDHTFDVELGLGETLELEVHPGEELPPEPDVSPRPAAQVRTDPMSPLNRRTLAYVAGGVGAAGIIGALTAGAFAYGEKQTMDDECDADRNCSQKGLDARDRGATYALVSNISGAVGVVALGTGVYLFLTSQEPSASPQKASTLEIEGVQVEAGTFAGYQGLRFSGQF